LKFLRRIMMAKNKKISNEEVVAARKAAHGQNKPKS